MHKKAHSPQVFRSRQYVSRLLNTLMLSITMTLPLSQSAVADDSLFAAGEEDNLAEVSVPEDSAAGNPLGDARRDVMQLSEKLERSEAIAPRIDTLDQRIQAVSSELDDSLRHGNDIDARLTSLESSVKAFVAMTEERLSDMSVRLSSDRPEADVKEDEVSASSDTSAEPETSSDTADSDEASDSEPEDAAEDSNSEPRSEASEAVADKAADDDKEET